MEKTHDSAALGGTEPAWASGQLARSSNTFRRTDRNAAEHRVTLVSHLGIDITDRRPHEELLAIALILGAQELPGHGHQVRLAVPGGVSTLTCAA